MITTTFLKIADIADLHPPEQGCGSITDPSEMQLQKIVCPTACSSMYSIVGKPQYWELYRCGWAHFHWQRHLQRADIEVSYICAGDKLRVGYLELQLHDDSSVEVAYFGLAPAFIGHGMGGHALVLAIKRGLELGTNGVWLHTCSLDHPSALKNYYARGFKFVREEVTNYLPLDIMPEIVNRSMEAT